MMSFLLDNAKIIALLGFFAGFIWIAATLLRPSAKKDFEEHARIPFKEPE
jgi:cbb3-type cytochrome oxidase subunit 3